MLAYNEFTFAVTLVDTPSKQTFPVLYNSSLPAAPAAIAASLPLIVIFAFLWYFFLRDEVGRWTS
jgi:ABC-type glycerol-3-phosphate transport system permease component